ncbi:MAG: hypothetical protein ABI833_22235 [Acidobacteriota bacterium]
MLEKTGKIVFLRAHDLGTAFGPPNDQLDVEAVFILNAIGDGAFGFQLRNDNKLPARQAMFSLLRDAFVNNLTVTADFLIDPGKKNGVAIRVALTRNQIRPIPPVVLAQGSSGQVLPAPSARAQSKAKTTKARSKPKRRKAR